MAVRMTYWPVDASLAMLVDWIYVFRADGPVCEGLAGALLPQLQWRLEGAFAWSVRTATCQWMTGAGLLGASSGALSLQTEGRTTVVGCGIYPEGWAALLGVPAAELNDRAVDLAAIWGSDASLPLLADPGEGDAALAAHVNDLLLRRLARARAVDPRLALISHWANGSRQDIDGLLAHLGVTHRHLDRLAQSAHGLSPRLLANKHKILRMAAVLATGEHDNRRETWTTQYADQAHFIRNFRRFVGVTPTRFVADESLLVRDVLRSRQMIASGHPLGLAGTNAGPSA